MVWVTIDPNFQRDIPQDDKEVEIHTVTDIDPVQSYNSNKVTAREKTKTVTWKRDPFWGGKYPEGI